MVPRGNLIPLTWHDLAVLDKSFPTRPQAPHLDTYTPRCTTPRCLAPSLLTPNDIVGAITQQPGGRLLCSKACLAAQGLNKKDGALVGSQNRHKLAMKRVPGGPAAGRAVPCQYHAHSKLASQGHGEDGRCKLTAELPCIRATPQGRPQGKFALLQARLVHILPPAGAGEGPPAATATHGTP